LLLINLYAVFKGTLKFFLSKTLFTLAYMKSFFNPRNFFVLFTVFLGVVATHGEEKKTKPMNVLFIAVDDLRPELGCYGVPYIKSPNIDRFAASGTVFDHHYVQFAVCIPSRAALLTSLSSERTHQVYGPPVWENVQDVQSWGKTFQLNGFEAVALGKIWHIQGGKLTDTFDVLDGAERKDYADPQNEKVYEEWRDARKKAKGTKMDEEEMASGCPIAEAYDGQDTDYTDGKLTQDAIAQMNRLKNGAKPFMLAVGYHKPHIPFVAPKRYWDLYDPKALPLAPNPKFPQAMPEVAWSQNPNFHTYTYAPYESLPNGDMSAQVMPEASARWIRHGYFACVSFVDAQVGLLLNALEKNGLAENTIVVLWGDHGYHLGDVNMWGKQSNFEEAARSPLIVRVPGKTKAGTHSPALVESVDILPTLVDLCGMKPLPLTDGKSFVPVLSDPNREWKTAVFHVFNRNAPADASNGNKKKQLVIGHAVRTADYRLVDWRMGWNLSGKRIAEELYDYKKDPYETKNVASDPSYSEILHQLEEKIRQGPASLNP
jgi:iduronate 2-sulfatase